jgi:hypothetical protein
LLHLRGRAGITHVQLFWTANQIAAKGTSFWSAVL